MSKQGRKAVADQCSGEQYDKAISQGYIRSEHVKLVLKPLKQQFGETAVQDQCKLQVHCRSRETDHLKQKTEKGWQRGSIATRKVFAHPESFCALNTKMLEIDQKFSG